MELSCDERVLKEMDENIKKPYAASLLSWQLKGIFKWKSVGFWRGKCKGQNQECIKL